MTTRYLVDPELVVMLDQFPTLELTDETLGQVRAMLETMYAQMLPNVPEFPDITVSERFAPGPEGAPDVRMLVTSRPPCRGRFQRYSGFMVEDMSLARLTQKTSESRALCQPWDVLLSQ